MTKKTHFRRFILLLFVAALAVWGGALLYRHFFSSAPGELSGAADKAEQGRNAGFKLPPLPLSPANMSAAQKQRAAKQAYADAQAAALAAGQTAEQAAQAGQLGLAAAQKAMARPAAIGGKP